MTEYDYTVRDGARVVQFRAGACAGGTHLPHRVHTSVPPVQWHRPQPKIPNGGGGCWRLCGPNHGTAGLCGRAASGLRRAIGLVGKRRGSKKGNKTKQTGDDMEPSQPARSTVPSPPVGSLAAAMQALLMHDHGSARAKTRGVGCKKTGSTTASRTGTHRGNPVCEQRMASGGGGVESLLVFHVTQPLGVTL